MPGDQLCVAYYCSGHGYGHATRVSAFARHILTVRTEGEGRHIVHIVSSAPRHIFADALDLGAEYRHAEIDPVIVQPIAYRVNRRKSLEVLKKFLGNKKELLERECQWLQQINADCVLSDAAFLACLAAKSSGLPSVLITNFSFDSVYSYFSTTLSDVAIFPGGTKHMDHSSLLDIVPDEPIPYEEISPFVDQIHMGYRCADLLVRLPGYIPIPSFYVHPCLPSFKWVDEETRRLKPETAALLGLPHDEQALLPTVDPFPVTPQSLPNNFQDGSRKVLQGPLLVRSPSTKLSVYTPEGRSALLSTIGVPAHLHDPSRTKILVVSFGGQTFKRPHTPSRPGSSRKSSTQNLDKSLASSLQDGLSFSTRSGFMDSNSSYSIPSRRLATPDHIWIPGAPPACKPSLSPSSTLQAISLSPSSIPTFVTPPTPNSEFFSLNQGLGGSIEADSLPQLLPDSSWIAIVCGVSKEQWETIGEDEDLPEEFYVAPRDVYMPDLTAVGDVLLGKLGYGTVSECVDACTPFIYVSRPLFVEEHGLRLLLEQDGIGVELSRQSYEAGEWASAVDEAYLKGRSMKEAKRRDMRSGIGLGKREEEIKDLALEVLGWIRDWSVNRD